MAGLSSLLNTARDALSAQSYGLNVAGQNVTNANTPLYVRREAVLQTRAVGNVTTGGVEVQGLRRASDDYADRRLFESQSLSSAASQQDNELQSIEGIFNDLGGTGLGSSLDALYSSFQQVAATPNDPTVRQDILNKAEVFASRVNDIGDSLATRKADLVDQAKAIASQANQRAQEIAKLNNQIVIAHQAGQDASDLVDQRNTKLLDLATLIDVRTIAGQNGDVMVQSAGTMLIEGGTARTLSVGMGTDGKMQILSKRGDGPSYDVTAFVTGGKLAGIKEARDTNFFDISDKFDRFVFDTASAINTQHKAGVGLDGNGGRNVFDVGLTYGGTARSIKLSGDVAGHPEFFAAAGNVAELPGGSSNAVKLGQLQGIANVFANSRTPSQAYGDLIGQVGSTRATSKAEAELRGNIFQQSQAFRETVSGVSLDEEMVSLQRFQRAFEAAGKVIATVDGLMENLMQRVGR